MGTIHLRAAVIAALAVGFAAPTAVQATPPIWEADQGTTITGLTSVDDGDAPTAALGTFAFPFYGTTYTNTDVLTVGSNGWFVFGSHAGTVTDNTPDSREWATRAFPSVAPFHTDLITSDAGPGVAEQGDVLLKTFNDDGDPAVDRLVITWKANNFSCGIGVAYPGCKNDAQVQLFESGKIVFGYDGIFPIKGGGSSEAALVGVSKGGLANTDDPGSRDLSAGGFPAAFGLTGYEKFVGDPLKFDLDQRNLVLTPTGATGFSVDQLGEDIAVSLSGPATAVAGGTVTYTATVKNNGESAASGVALVTPVPNGTEFVSASAGCTAGAVVTCPIGDLAPGASATASVSLKANIAGALVVNTTGRPSQAGDPAPDNTASATTTVSAPPGAADTVPGTLPPKPKVSGKAASQKLGAAASGIKVSLTCAAACGASVTATIDTATARKLRSGKTLGSTSGGTEKAGTVTFKVPVGSAVGKRIRRQKSLRVKLTFVISTEAGETTTSSTVTIRK